MLEHLAPMATGNPLVQRLEIIGEQTEEDFICRPLSFPAAIGRGECRDIVRLGERAAAVSAGLMHPVEGYRSGATRVIPLGADSRWLYERISEILVRVNQWYRFDIKGFVDSLLYCEYPEQGHFDWHVDCGEGYTRTRKISLSVQLSEPSEYDGGGLEFAAHGELRGARRLGTAVTFPAFVHHRVAPVMRGVRRSLVAWAHGPVFR
jgi:PKHD-type hydroxylase